MMIDPKYSKAELDNHANQLNRNNSAYWSSRCNNDETYADSYMKHRGNNYEDDKFYEENYSSEGFDSSDF